MPGLNPRRLQAIRQRENEAFKERTKRSWALGDRARRHMPNGVPMSWMSGLYSFPPIYVSHGDGATFTDVDGNRYLDFNVCDLSMTMGFGSGPIVEAVSRATRTGAHFLLPTEDAIAVAENLAQRVGVPHWQFTLSASGANTEVMRIARVMTGRDKVAVLEGHYHGHLDETLVATDPRGRTIPEMMGTSSRVAADTILLPFNDLDAVVRLLANGDAALVLTEPVLTNCNLVMTRPGFLKGLRDITKRHNALLCYDDAHRFQFAYGGLTGAWRLDTDFVVLGKGLGTGISFALYGMSDDVARTYTRHTDIDFGAKGIATGGTTYGSAVAVATARSALGHVLTPSGYDRIGRLGGCLSDGLDGLFRRHGLLWQAHRMGPRSGYCLTPHLPVNGREAWLAIDEPFVNTRRIYMANRGLWDAASTAGPQASFAHTDGDIETYLAAADAFLHEITVETAR